MPPYSLVNINCNAGQQNAILPLCSLFTSYNCTVGTQFFMLAPLAPSKLFNCFTIAVSDGRRKVVTVNFHQKPCIAINFHKTVYTIQNFLVVYRHRSVVTHSVDTHKTRAILSYLNAIEN